MVGCPGTQTTTIMYLRTVYLRINLRLNNIFCCLSNFDFLSPLDYQITQSQISKWPFVILSTFSFCISTSQGLIIISKNSISLTFHQYFSGLTNRSFFSSLFNISSTNSLYLSSISIITIMSLMNVVIFS